MKTDMKIEYGNGLLRWYMKTQYKDNIQKEYKEGIRWECKKISMHIDTKEFKIQNKYSHWLKGICYKQPHLRPNPNPQRYHIFILTYFQPFNLAYPQTNDAHYRDFTMVRPDHERFRSPRNNNITLLEIQRATVISERSLADNAVDWEVRSHNNNGGPALNSRRFNSLCIV